MACIHLAYDMPSRLLKKACLISITECVAVSYLLLDYIDLALYYFRMLYKCQTNYSIHLPRRRCLVGSKVARA